VKWVFAFSYILYTKVIHKFNNFGHNKQKFSADRGTNLTLDAYLYIYNGSNRDGSGSSPDAQVKQAKNESKSSSIAQTQTASECLEKRKPRTFFPFFRCFTEISQKVLYQFGLFSHIL
ncbi:MAG: hypothetical protein J6B54_05865, partial [Clostridia bacterium]|nr:hypothetical protein [Clostridia bacterium]